MAFVNYGKRHSFEANEPLIPKRAKSYILGVVTQRGDTTTIEEPFMPNRPILAAFDRGQIPTIACFNQAKTPLGVDFGKLCAALQAFLEKCFVPVWGTPAKVVPASGFVKGAWAMAFLDTADVQGALGYHDLTPDGFPLSKIFVKTTIDDEQKVSVTACHELAEMLVDPAINLCATGPKNMIYAYETCDAVEALEFPVNGIPMSDFVYPSFFEGFRKAGSTQFDYLKKVSKPFQILKGGYMPVFKNGQWTQIFGSEAKRKAFMKEDRRGHRTEIRKERHTPRV